MEDGGVVGGDDKGDDGREELLLLGEDGGDVCSIGTGDVMVGKMERSNVDDNLFISSKFS